MTQVLEQAIHDATLPDDINVGKKDEHVTVDNKTVKIKSLKLSGILRLLTALKSIGLKAIPQQLSPVDLLTGVQRDALRAITDDKERVAKLGEQLASLSPEQKFLLRRAAAERANAIFEWVCESETLLPVALSATTNLSASESAELEVADALMILTKAIDLVNWDSLFEAGYSFFNRTGALGKAARRLSDKTTKAAATTEKSTTT